MRIFITGITGTLGTALAFLHYSRGDQVWGCAKSEGRTANWLRGCHGPIQNHELATVFVGCASNLTSRNGDMGRLIPTMNRLYHCAAMKHVDLCEKNLAEAIWQNVTVTHKVVMACSSAKVPLVFISSDKACLADSVYGATKLIGERMVLAANGSGAGGVGNSVVRLGNVIGSSGSVFERWANDIRSHKQIQITDPEMTRYFISQSDAAHFIADQHLAGSIAIPYLLSAEMGDLVTTLCKCKKIDPDRLQVVGMRPGESKHQWIAAPGSKLLIGEHRILLHPDGAVDPNGLSSDTAVRWQSQALLQLAGLI